MRFGNLCVLFVLLFCAAFCRAATYYVSTNGNNGNSGSGPGAGDAWRNVHKAAGTATEGDLVIIGPGEFNEFVTNLNSGTAASPITFTGTRGSGGEWLTIIDPSTILSNNWYDATVEVGAGVWKNTNSTFRVADMTIAGKRVGFCWSPGYMPTMRWPYNYPAWTNGLQIIAVASDATVYNNLNANTTAFWDGIEALFCSTVTSGVVSTYLRLRDGSDPNGLLIRVAPNNDSGAEQTLVRPAVKIQSKNWITYSNLHVCGGIGQFSIVGAAGITLKSNRIVGGYTRALLSAATNCVVNDNTFTTDWYGGNEMGAWGSGDSAVYDKHINQYLVGKYLMGVSEQHDLGVKITGGSLSNSLGGNLFANTLNDAITVGWPAHWTWITNNIVTNCSAHGIFFWIDQTNTYCAGNHFANCNHIWRFMDWATPSSNDARQIYCYRNTVWGPDSVGSLLYWDGSYVSGYSTTNKVVWMYHNSFSGGRAVHEVSYPIAEAGGLIDVRFINNIENASPHYKAAGEDQSWNFITNSYMFNYDYNLWTTPQTYPTATNPAWVAVHNIKSTTNIWTNLLGMSFLINSNSQAIDAALDVSTTFTLKGVEYPALPQTASTKSGSAWDMGALEYSDTPETPSTVKVKLGGPATLKGPFKLQ